MYRVAVICAVLALFANANGNVFDFTRLSNYTRVFGLSPNDTSNELWYGIIKDCSKRVSFSCIQKNAYTYLDKTFIDRDNITIFDGVRLTKNNLDYECVNSNPKNNLVEDDSDGENSVKTDNASKVKGEKMSRDEEEEEEEYLSPLEEVTYALRKKAIKFIATRDYEIRLPRLLGGGANIKISPREVDDTGALIRLDFTDLEIQEGNEQGRLFLIKKIKNHIKNKLLTALLVAIILIKIIKVKFMFVIPFLFGIGTAKKLFLKLLLFLVPAFAHVFKLCSSYYSSHATKYHHHHHKVAHHHHHIPVPVPVPQYSKPYYDHPPPSYSHGSSGGSPIVLDEDFPGYDYAHPHIQYRKDIDELKEWGIEPYDESYDQIGPEAGVIHPGPIPTPGPKFTLKFPAPFGLPPPYAANTKLLGSGLFGDKMRPPPNPQSLAYAGYGPPLPPPPLHSGRQPLPAASLPVGVIAPPDIGPPKSLTKQTKQELIFGPADGYLTQQQQHQQQNQQQQPVFNHQKNNDLQQLASESVTAVPVAKLPSQQSYDDEFYGPIVERLDEIFNQLRFSEEKCRERLVCSMYKNPALFAPHSNLVSSELSRDPQELQTGNTGSNSSIRFHRYLNAARMGQDGGDCLRAFHCSINTE